MAKIGKRRAELLKKLEPLKAYGLEEGIELALSAANAKFDESVEIHVRLNVDPRQADQQVRSTVDYVGSTDLVDKIKGGWMDFEAVVATPEMMKFIGPLGKVLGPRGLMPSAKAGTVTANVGSTVKEIKAGRVEYRVDKFGILHNAIGKASFGKDKILENVKAYYAAVLKSRPVAVKGAYVKSLTLSTSMGLGVRIDAADAEKICAAVAE